MRARTTFISLLGLLPACAGAEAVFEQPPEPAERTQLPTLEEVLAARHDLWGEAALRQPNGPSYAFFEPLLPPLRWVNAEFRHHPVILCQPGGEDKLRVASNGAGVELPARAPMWADDREPVHFFVGKEREPFGADLARLDGPRWGGGWVPALENRYRHGEAVVEQIVFPARRLVAGTEVFVRFELLAGAREELLVRFGDGARPPARAWLDLSWLQTGAPGELVAEIEPRRPATLALFTRTPGHRMLDERLFERQLQDCVQQWVEELAPCLELETPEPRVNEAWRAQLAGILLLAREGELLYSARNGYERTFQAECGDAALALALWGHPGASRYVRGLLRRPLQQGIEGSDRAFQLQLLAATHALTRERELVDDMRGTWKPAADALAAGREPSTGLLPPENYCGDLSRQVRPLHANASAWRGLRDLAALLQDLGGPELAERYANAARELRASIIAAVEQAARTDVDPPFVPNVLLGEEELSEPLTATTEGSYWNLLAPFTLASGVFPPGDPRPTWIVRTLRERGGLCMGLLRFDQHSGLYANERALDDLYTLRYALHCLDRDEPELALVSFYGKLAQGMTRGTLVSAEGSGLVPEDQSGRSMYLPPVISGNAFFLQLLRHLLVHERDLDDDGVADALDLASAPPRRWLADRATIVLRRAPSAFGRLGFELESRLSRGEVVARVTPPGRAAGRMRLFLRLPGRHELVSASIDGVAVPFDERGTVDVIGRTRPFEVRCEVRVER